MYILINHQMFMEEYIKCNTIERAIINFGKGGTVFNIMTNLKNAYTISSYSPLML